MRKILSEITQKTNKINRITEKTLTKVRCLGIKVSTNELLIPFLD